MNFFCNFQLLILKSNIIWETEQKKRIKGRFFRYYIFVNLNHGCSSRIFRVLSQSNIYCFVYNLTLYRLTNEQRLNFIIKIRALLRKFIACLFFALKISLHFFKDGVNSNATVNSKRCRQMVYNFVSPKCKRLRLRLRNYDMWGQ